MRPWEGREARTLERRPVLCWWLQWDCTCWWLQTGWNRGKGVCRAGSGPLLGVGILSVIWEPRLGLRETRAMGKVGGLHLCLGDPGTARTMGLCDAEGQAEKPRARGDRRQPGQSSPAALHRQAQQSRLALNSGRGFPAGRPTPLGGSGCIHVLFLSRHHALVRQESGLEPDAENTQTPSSVNGSLHWQLG